MKKFFFPAIVLAFGLLLLSSCTKDNDNDTATASVNFYLTDGPATYDEVNVAIESVEVHTNQSGWQTLDLIHPGVYNLIELSNGMDTLLSRATLPAGTLSQIRLILGADNSVVVNGQSYPLATPSAMQSGLKLNFHQTLVANGAYDIWIDFDAHQSVVKQGNGSYLLKPVIRAYSDETNGQIKGFVLPVLAAESVVAVNNVDTFYAYPDMLDGFFMFSGLPEGSYSVHIDAAATSGLSDTTLVNVPVTYGEVTSLGTITLLP